MTVPYSIQWKSCSWMPTGMRTTKPLERASSSVSGDTVRSRQSRLGFNSGRAGRPVGQLYISSSVCDQIFNRRECVLSTPSRPSRYEPVNVRLLERLAAMLTAEDIDELAVIRNISFGDGNPRDAGYGWPRVSTFSLNFLER